jgi:hypothetical protein
MDSLDLEFPIVAKPCRGRGSAGVKLCRITGELARHVGSLYQDSSVVMLEEFRTGEEATVTVMPRSRPRSDYRALPAVTRFNHEDGIAPHNGNVAVTSKFTSCVGISLCRRQHVCRSGEAVRRRGQAVERERAYPH